ncbi:hypothetical protein GCM10009687_61340 [Asanoa iriomotensis]
MVTAGSGIFPGWPVEPRRVICVSGLRRVLLTLPGVTPDHEPETEVIVSAAEPLDSPGVMLGQEAAAPVFVDETGRRRRLVRFVAYGIGAVCLGYTALVGVSIAGGPALPHALMPFPDRALQADEAPTQTPERTSFRPPSPGPFVAPLPPAPVRAGTSVLRTSAIAVTAKPTPSPTKGTQPVSPPPVTSEPTRPPEGTPTPQPTDPPTEPPAGPEPGNGGGGSADQPPGGTGGTGGGETGGGATGGSGAPSDGGGTDTGGTGAGGGDGGSTGGGSATPDPEPGVPAPTPDPSTPAAGAA